MKQAKQKHCNKNNNRKRKRTTDAQHIQKKNKQPITKQNKTMCKHKVGKWIRKEKKSHENTKKMIIC